MGCHGHRFSISRNFLINFSYRHCIILISYQVLSRLSDLFWGSPGLRGSKGSHAPLNLCVPTSINYTVVLLVPFYTKPVKKAIVPSPQKGNWCWLELLFWINAIVVPPRSTVPSNMSIAAVAFTDSTNVSALMIIWNTWLLELLYSLFWNLSLS